MHSPLPLKISLLAPWIPIFSIALLFPQLFLTGDYRLPRDAGMYSEPMFTYWVHWIRAIGTVPDWFFTTSGGTWLEPMSNLYFLFLPHKILGILGAAFLGGNPSVWYKISFLLIDKAYG